MHIYFNISRTVYVCAAAFSMYNSLSPIIIQYNNTFKHHTFMCYPSPMDEHRHFKDEGDFFLNERLFQMIRISRVHFHICKR